MPNYQNFFPMTHPPFEQQTLRPLVLETGPMRRVCAWIRSELAAGTPHLVVLGSRGIGKSSTAMALRHLLEDRVACIPDPTRPWNELAASIADDFDLDARSLSRQAILASRPAPTVRLVLVVDDANELPAESLTRLRRVLDYADARGRPLVRCILLANPDGRASEATRWVMAIKSRIELAPMLARELQRYIEARLHSAGWKVGELFTREAVEAIHHASGGSPTAANRICEALLVEAAQRKERSIGQRLAEEICAEIRLGPVASEAEATEPALRVDAPTPKPSPGESDALLPSLRVDIPTPSPNPVASDAPVPATRLAAAPKEKEKAREPASRSPSRVEAPNHEAAPPPREHRRAPESPWPQGPGAHEPLPRTQAGPPIEETVAPRSGALRSLAAHWDHRRWPAPVMALAARLAPLKSLAAHWDHRRWQVPVLTIGLTAVLLIEGRIATVPTVEPATVEHTAGGAATVAREHPDPPVPASGTTVSPIPEWQLESGPVWLGSLRGEIEGAVEVRDPEGVESVERVAPAAAETPEHGVAEPAETRRTQTAEPAETRRTQTAEPAETRRTQTAEPAEARPTQIAEPAPPARWLNDLDLDLDLEAKAGRPGAPPPSLALPEPELSRGFSPGGEIR
jgi:type II secretory pathway predicted ATPase ExeA